MRVLIFESDMCGHRASTVRTLLDALAALPSAQPMHLAVASTESSFETTAFREQVMPLEHAFERIVLAPLPTLFAGRADGRIRRLAPLQLAHEKARALRRLTGQQAFDHLYVPFADGTAQALGLRARLGLKAFPEGLIAEGLVMNTPFASVGAGEGGKSPAGPAQRLHMASLNHTPFHRLHLTNALALPAIARFAPHLQPKVRLIPDPVPMMPSVGREAARAGFGLSREHQVVGCVGGIDKRKGIDKLIRAFEQATLGENARLLLAGPHHASIREQLSQVSDARVISIDRYLSDEEIQRATDAIDLMAVLYEDYLGPSSTSIRAANAGRMNLGSQRGWLGHMIPAFELGAVADTSSAQRLALALPQALAASLQYEPSARAQRFARFYQAGNISACWTALLRERLGLAPDPGLTTWPDPATPA